MNHTYTSNVNLVDKVTVKGPLGTKRLLRPNRQVSLIVGSIKRGALDVYFGCDADGSTVPDLHFGQVNRPISVPIPCGQYEFAIICADSTEDTEGSIILGGPRE